MSTNSANGTKSASARDLNATPAEVSPASAIEDSFARFPTQVLTGRLDADQSRQFLAWMDGTSRPLKPRRGRTCAPERVRAMEAALARGAYRGRRKLAQAQRRLNRARYALPPPGMARLPTVAGPLPAGIEGESSEAEEFEIRNVSTDGDIASRAVKFEILIKVPLFLRRES